MERALKNTVPSQPASEYDLRSQGRVWTTLALLQLNSQSDAAELRLRVESAEI